MASNVKIDRKGDVVTITCNVSDKTIKAAGMSKKGKSKIVAGTGGFIDLDGPGDLKLSLNLIAPVGE